METYQFRVWSKSQQKMIYDFRITFADFPLNNLFRLSGYEFMLNTGRKDHLGIEIFQGDILRNKEGGLAKVVYDADNMYMPGFNLGAVDASRGVSGIWHLNEWQVVGNIYENKELIQL